jgi:hypothetical protein
MEPAIAAGLGEFMGKVHAATHSSTLSTEEKHAYVTKYENCEMKDVQLEFVFTKCYKEATHKQQWGLNVTPKFLQEIELLKQQYNGQLHSLVVSHGDWNTIILSLRNFWQGDGEPWLVVAHRQIFNADSVFQLQNHNLRVYQGWSQVYGVYGKILCF